MDEKLSPTMQAKLEDLEAAYRSSGGRPVQVSAKNQTVGALIRRGKLEVVSTDGTNSFVAPAGERGTVSFFKRAYAKLTALRPVRV